MECVSDYFAKNSVSAYATLLFFILLRTPINTISTIFCFFLFLESGEANPNHTSVSEARKRRYLRRSLPRKLQVIHASQWSPPSATNVLWKCLHRSLQAKHGALRLAREDLLHSGMVNQTESTWTPSLLLSLWLHDWKDSKEVKG